MDQTKIRKIRIGTCSWTDPTLISCGRFYPDSTRSAEARLKYYSDWFQLIEVDSTYYAMPREKISRLWAQRTTEDFIFDIKAFRLFTQHPTPINSLPKDIRQNLTPGLQQKNNLYYHDMPGELTTELWQRFESSLLPLDTVAKLGIVLFQFPPWFYPETQQFDYILSCKNRLPQYRLAIEFRNNLWLNEANRDSTFNFLRENNLPFVCVDEPQGFKSSVSPIAKTTSDIGLLRFHGRNSQTWEQKGLTPAGRFNYLYSEEELEPWAARIIELSEQSKEMHVLFNNCYEDKAVVNAKQMSFMLRSKTTLLTGEE